MTLKAYNGAESLSEMLNVIENFVFLSDGHVDECRNIQKEGSRGTHVGMPGL
jgi:hypothetical protein